MSEKPITFLNKINHCLTYLFDRRWKKGAIVTCNNCGSINIAIDNTNTDNLISNSQYTCLDCGCRCTAHQQWQTPELDLEMGNDDE